MKLSEIKLVKITKIASNHPAISTCELHTQNYLNGAIFFLQWRTTSAIQVMYGRCSLGERTVLMASQGKEPHHCHCWWQSRSPWKLCCRQGWLAAVLISFKELGWLLCICCSSYLGSHARRSREISLRIC